MRKTAAPPLAFDFAVVCSGTDPAPSRAPSSPSWAMPHHSSLVGAGRDRPIDRLVAPLPSRHATPDCVPANSDRTAANTCRYAAVPGAISSKCDACGTTVNVTWSPARRAAAAHGASCSPGGTIRSSAAPSQICLTPSGKNDDGDPSRARAASRAGVPPAAPRHLLRTTRCRARKTTEVGWPGQCHDPSQLQRRRPPVRPPTPRQPPARGNPQRQMPARRMPHDDRHATYRARTSARVCE